MGTPCDVPILFAVEVCGALLGLRVEIRLEELRESVDRFLRAIAFGAQHDLVAVAGPECHEHKDRGSIDRRTADLLDRHLCGLLTRGLRKNSGGAGVEPGSGRNLNGAFCHDVPFDEPGCRTGKHQRKKLSEATLPNDAAGELVGNVKSGAHSQPADLLEVRIENREDLKRSLRLA